MFRKASSYSQPYTCQIDHFVVTTNQIMRNGEDPKAQLISEAELEIVPFGKLEYELQSDGLPYFTLEEKLRNGKFEARVKNT